LLAAFTTIDLRSIQPRGAGPHRSAVDRCKADDCRFRPDFRCSRSARYCGERTGFAFGPDPRRLCCGMDSGVCSMARGFKLRSSGSDGWTATPDNPLGKERRESRPEPVLPI
jgi:hypothetical protein